MRPIQHRAGAALVTDDRVLEQLAAEARYQRQRYDLYRARMYGLRATSQRRLLELQRACDGAESRLAAARRARAARAGTDST